MRIHEVTREKPRLSIENWKLGRTNKFLDFKKRKIDVLKFLGQNDTIADAAVIEIVARDIDLYMFPHIFHKL